ncbi:MAG TPA: VanZ family protein [Jiangellales bacterium]|nr:VanZ family protein [Jiangellales bacterium]
MTPTATGPDQRARLLLVAAVVVNLLVLYLPDPPSVGGGDGLLSADTLVHVAVFAAVAWTGRAAGVPVVLLVAALVVHAVASEVVQHLLLPGRTGDVRDVLADLAGVGLGLLLPVRERVPA